MVGSFLPGWPFQPTILSALQRWDSPAIYSTQIVRSWLFVLVLYVRTASIHARRYCACTFFTAESAGVSSTQFSSLLSGWALETFSVSLSLLYSFSSFWLKSKCSSSPSHKDTGVHTCACTHSMQTEMLLDWVRACGSEGITGAGEEAVGLNAEGEVVGLRGAVGLIEKLWDWERSFVAEGKVVELREKL